MGADRSASAGSICRVPPGRRRRGDSLVVGVARHCAMRASSDGKFARPGVNGCESAADLRGRAGAGCRRGPEIAAGVGLDVIFRRPQAGIPRCWRPEGRRDDARSGGLTMAPTCWKKADGHLDVGGAGDLAREADCQAARRASAIITIAEMNWLLWVVGMLGDAPGPAARPEDGCGWAGSRRVRRTRSRAPSWARTDQFVDGARACGRCRR